MKRTILYIMVFLGAVSCLDIGQDNPFEENTHEMAVSLKFPEKIDGHSRSGIEVELYNINTGGHLKAVTGSDGIARIQAVNGMYRVSSSILVDEIMYNASEDRVKISGKDRTLELLFNEIIPGDLLIKELYVGGCSMMPVEPKDYQSDKYVLLHNNTDKIYYLDSLCIGTLSPYNSTANNPWLKEDPFGNTVYPAFLPVIQAVWRIGGNGTTFPLEPGKDAVIAFCGAIDHAAIYPESVNLNREDCFACYNHKFFPNPAYHPVPGDKIGKERYMELVIKTGRANAYSISVSCPTFIIFKAAGQSIEDFITDTGNIIPVPGSSVDKVTCIPPEWVIDGMEVFNGSSSENTKRLLPSIDAGAVFQSTTHKGKALRRRVNEKKSAEMGYEVLTDTNNSSKDFYEAAHASLWKEEAGK